MFEIKVLDLFDSSLALFRQINVCQFVSRYSETSVGSECISRKGRHIFNGRHLENQRGIHDTFEYDRGHLYEQENRY